MQFAIYLQIFLFFLLVASQNVVPLSGDDELEWQTQDSKISDTQPGNTVNQDTVVAYIPHDNLPVVGEPIESTFFAADNSENTGDGQR